MKTRNYLPKIVAILFIIISISSCDEDFNTIGAEIIGDDSLLSVLDDSHTVISYSRKNAPVQTNNSPLSQLGVYYDQTFGKSTYNFSTQLLLSTVNPIFADELGQEVVLDSVILYIPFYSENILGEEETTYTLDSVYGDSPIKIEMFESNFFLRELDPDSGFEDPQLYYSNQGEEFENFLGDNIISIEDFVPSDEGYILTATTPAEIEGEEDVVDSTFVNPGVRTYLPVEFFQEKILDKEGGPELNNNNNFKNYFRGLYFRTSSETNDGSMFKFNNATASITLYYHFERPKENDLGEPILDENGIQIIDTINSEFPLNFGGVNLNTFDNDLSSEVAAAIENPNTVIGE